MPTLTARLLEELNHDLLGPGRKSVTQTSVWQALEEKVRTVRKGLSLVTWLISDPPSTRDIGALLHLQGFQFSSDSRSRTMHFPGAASPWPRTVQLKEQQR